MRTFESLLKSVQGYLRDSIKIHGEVEDAYQSGNLEKTYDKTFELAKKSESLTESVRLLPIYTGKKNAKEDVENFLCEEKEIKIARNEGESLLHVSFEALLPKKEKGRSGYLRTSLLTAFKKDVEKNPFEEIEEEVVLVFMHSYGRSDRMWRDHDNIEVNVAVDAITLYYLADDTSKNCAHFYFSKEGEKDKTDIFIVKKEKFGKFIEKHYKNT